MMRKVLVVDDEISCCEMLSDFLEARGFEPLVAFSGEEALEAYGQERPDLVLLDIRMPGKDGIETLREIKAMDPSAEVVMVTALHERELGLESIAQGAFDYVTKPIDCRYLDLVLKAKLVDLNGRPREAAKEPISALEVEA
jgi:DNA-binding response OmpR family regulator